MAVWSSIPTSRLVGAMRLDAEFWHPAYLQNEHAIRRANPTSLSNLVTVFKKGIFYILAREYAQSGIAFYRSSNVGAILPKEDGLVFITEQKHKEEWNTALERGDLMIVKTGQSGASVVIRDRCNVSQDVIAIKIRRERVNPYYLAVYLNTKFGASEMNRWFQGQVQPHLSLDDARRIWVSLIDSHEQQEIERVVRSAALAQEVAEKLYNDAEHLLESVLGIDKLSFSKQVGCTARFSELVQSLRADAQHYQPRFAQLLAHLTAFSLTNVRSLRHYNRRGVQPTYVSQGQVAVVNSQHLGSKHIAYDGLESTTEAAYRSAPEAHIKRNDLLIYSTGAYVGRTNVYLDERPALASNHVNIIRLAPEIDAAYMALVFQSVIGQSQTQKFARGSAQAELYPVDIDRFVVPVIDANTQKEIGNLVRESLAKQRESKNLLAEARRRVEQLIEVGVQS